MSITKILLSASVCLAALTINCFAQIKAVTKKQYESVQRAAENNLEKKSYISSTKIEEYLNGKLIKSSIINEDTIPPGKMRYTETETSENKTTKLEIINVDDIEYRREDGGDWVKKDFGKSEDEDGSGGGFGISGQESPNKKKYTIEDVKLGSQMVRIYSVSTIYDYDPNTLLTYKRWINSANLILKTEGISSEIDSGKITRRELVEYEYNPKNLKIEAPIK